MFHFYFEAPNISDWISLGLTLFGLIIGLIALNQWEKQKQWEITSEAIANASNALGYLTFCYSPAKYILYHQGKATLTKKEGAIQRDSFMENLIEESHKYANTAERTRFIYEKLNFSFKKNNVVIDFYAEIVRLLDELDSIKRKIVLIELAVNIEKGETKESLDRIEKHNETLKKLRENSGPLPDEIEKDLEKKLQSVKIFRFNKWFYLSNLFR